MWTMSWWSRQLAFSHMLTKGRMKRTDRLSKDGHVVHSDGVALAFPGWTEHEPIEQAHRNARWLGKMAFKRGW
jgi:hypothetical protein